ncbi:MAG: tetratricopeptide repeat protein [candidate division WOR-3 bacterium]
MIKKIIDKIEKEKYSFINIFLTLFSIILTRNILESSFEEKQILGFSIILSNSFYMLFVHFPLFYFSIFLWVLLIFKFLTKEELVKIVNFLTFGISVIVIAPIIDVLVSKGSGYNLAYLSSFKELREAHRFFLFWKDIYEASWGQRVEILLILFGSFFYVVMKTKNYFKSIIAPLIIFVVILIHGVLPNTIANIPLYLGYKKFNPTTFLNSGILPIDSQNYGVIFSTSIILALILISYLEKKRLRELLSSEYIFISVSTFFIGILYALFLILKYYTFLLMDPIFYLIIFLGIWIIILTNRVSQEKLDSLEFQGIVTGIIIFSLSLGWIFLILVFILYLFKKFFRPKWVLILPSFLAGFSLIFQDYTLKAIIPIEKRVIELRGKELSAWTFFLNKEYKKALLLYLRINSLKKSDKETEKRIGQCLLNLGNLDEGIKLLEKIVNPDYETILSLAQAYTQSGKYKEAIDLYKKAIKKKLSYGEFYGKIAQLASRLGEENELNLAIEKASRYGIPKYKLYQIRGDFYLSKGDLESAWKMFNISLSYNPRFEASLSGKGIIYYKKGNLKEAEKQFLKALEIEPDNDAIFNNLGVIYLTQRNFEKAKDSFLKSLRLNPNQVEAYYNLGLIYEVEDKKLEAYQMYERALNISPDYFPAKLKIKELQK